MQAALNAQFFPRAEASVGGAAGDEDEPDDLEDDAVGDMGSAALWSDGLLGRQMVADEIIEVILLRQNLSGLRTFPGWEMAHPISPREEWNWS